MRTIKINYEFMKWHKLAVYISVFLIIISLLSIFFKGFNYGVDFKGGTLIEISFNKDGKGVIHIPFDSQQEFSRIKKRLKREE